MAPVEAQSDRAGGYVASMFEGKTTAFNRRLLGAEIGIIVAEAGPFLFFGFTSAIGDKSR
jgi:hypothetical protein